MDAKEIAEKWAQYHIQKNTRPVRREQRCLAQAYLKLLDERPDNSVVAKEIYLSKALWPEGTYPSGNDITTDKHTTFSAADAVCDLLQKEGWGGDRDIFPLKTWVTKP